MPATAAKIAEERGEPAPTAEALRDPAKNLEYASFYLAKQLAELGVAEDPERSVELCAAAYNGGERAARAFASNGTPLSDETSRYKDRAVALWMQRRAPALAR